MENLEKDYKRTMIAFIVVVVIAIIFIIWILISLSNLYNDGLSTCIGNGYSREYCMSILN